MQLSPHAQLAYCTNIHPAESWKETFTALRNHCLAVRGQLITSGHLNSYEQFAIGLRLSAKAAHELSDHHLEEFKEWLSRENCSVFTINGFPYGAFHNTRVKEQVYRPDWSDSLRLDYTKTMANILSEINQPGAELSISTLPGSFKAFHTDESAMFRQLHEIAEHLESLSQKNNQDIHLGLEPEPLGHFESLDETIRFFERLRNFAEAPEYFSRRIGVNYDTCHFALEYEQCHHALDALHNAGIRLSKIHLSNALAFDPNNPSALDQLKAFDEPTYLHQVLCKNQDGSIARFPDLPDFFAFLETNSTSLTEGRCHFHIPLYEQPIAPFSSTLTHAKDALHYLHENPSFCSHFEIETYTWGVLPNSLRLPIDDMIAEEYRWTLRALSSFKK